MILFGGKEPFEKLLKIKPQTILDIATGTGDLAVEASILKPTKIIGIDISDGMLAVGRKKMQLKGLDKMIGTKTKTPKTYRSMTKALMP